MIPVDQWTQYEFGREDPLTIETKDFHFSGVTNHRCITIELRPCQEHTDAQVTVASDGRNVARFLLTDLRNEWQVHELVLSDRQAAHVGSEITVNLTFYRASWVEYIRRRIASWR